MDIVSMDIKRLLIGRAKKFNQYSEGETTEGRSCKNCIRKNFSYPYTCNDGWQADKGATCINWTDNPRCQVG